MNVVFPTIQGLQTPPCDKGEIQGKGVPLYKVVPPLLDVYTSLATWKSSTSFPKSALIVLEKFNNIASNFELMVRKLQTTKQSVV
jgi:hypothetical protein